MCTSNPQDYWHSTKMADLGWRFVEKQTRSAGHKLLGRDRCDRDTVPSTSPRQSSLHWWWCHPGWRRSHRQLLLGGGIRKDWSIEALTSTNDRGWNVSHLLRSRKWPLPSDRRSGPRNHHQLRRKTRNIIVCERFFGIQPVGGSDLSASEEAVQRYSHTHPRHLPRELSGEAAEGHRRQGRHPSVEANPGAPRTPALPRNINTSLIPSFET